MYFPTCCNIPLGTTSSGRASDYTPASSVSAPTCSTDHMTNTRCGCAARTRTRATAGPHGATGGLCPRHAGVTPCVYARSGCCETCAMERRQRWLSTKGESRGAMPQHDTFLLHVVVQRGGERAAMGGPPGAPAGWTETTLLRPRGPAGVPIGLGAGAAESQQKG